MISTGTAIDTECAGFGSAPTANAQHGLDVAVLAAFTFIGYLALNWQFSGPTYLMDEIGYLANAATLSGRTIDAGSSYYAGYSLFLLPGFLLFNEPAHIWKSVLVANSLLFAASIILLHRMSGLFCDDRRLRFVAVALVALYPAYPVMAGYAYSTPGIVLIFVAASSAFCLLPKMPKAGMLIFALLVGFLNWVHPVGLPVAVAAVITLGALAWIDRDRIAMAVVSVLALVLMVLVYQVYLNPTLLDMMTPEGFKPSLHYSSVMDQLNPVYSPGGAVEFVTRFLAQIGIVLIATLALAGAGVAYVVNRLMVIGSADRRDSAERIAILLFTTLSVLGVAAFTAIIFTKPWSYFDNHWVHGRYIESVLAPFLLLSFLCSARRTQRIAVTLGVLTSLLVLYWMIGQEVGFTDEVEHPSFWPQTVFPAEPVFVWFLAGALACSIALFLPSLIVKGLLVGLYVLCISNQISWHHQSFRASANPTDLYRLVSDQYPDGTCVAYSPAGRDDIGNKPYERFNQLSFYLMNHDYRRMTPADWLEKCSGPYLTFDDVTTFNSGGAVLIAQTLDVGMKVYAKDPASDASHETYGRVFIRRSDENQNISYVARVNAEDLRGRIGVGKLDSGLINTTGSRGHAFYGPYGFLNAGKIRLEVYGRAGNVDGSYVDLATNGGNMIHGVFPIQPVKTARGLIAVGEIDVPEDLREFEIRLFVGSDADISFSHYDLEMIPK
ncbi:MAG: hypothetical protein NXI27_04490 [Alphaproteobacteria bacterium]|nr:hypothetical protein [Alphaproteobacteria bacterium]